MYPLHWVTEQHADKWTPARAARKKQSNVPKQLSTHDLDNTYHSGYEKNFGAGFLTGSFLKPKSRRPAHREAEH